MKNFFLSFVMPIVGTMLAILLAVAVFWLGPKVSQIFNRHSTQITYGIIPPISVASQTLDASLGSEFILTLTSNVNLGIVNIVNGRAVNLAVSNAEHEIKFTNPIVWLPSNTIPYALSNGLTLFSFFQSSNTIWGNMMRHNYLLVTNAGDFEIDVSREPDNWGNGWLTSASDNTRTVFRVYETTNRVLMVEKSVAGGAFQTIYSTNMNDSATNRLTN